MRLALDNFGTGYSSPSYLNRLAVQVLKIDRRFISGIGVRRSDQCTVQAMVDIARGLELVSVARAWRARRSWNSCASWAVPGCRATCRGHR